VVKLFPAEVVGGVDMIDALSAVWPNVRFMPTGGISPANLRSYLARPQVLAVGGSWIASKAAVASGDWTSIAAAAAAAVDVARGST
jgi:2-dehydro-3-deoxyphosphogluconate aldolase/(4S)-4-hydroxy-2-oxoglutarate aldolase